MNSSDLDMLDHLRHVNELVCEAQEERLARQARAGQKARNPLRRRALGSLGGWMVLCGSRLQKRYGATTMAPLTRAAECRH